MMYGLTYLYRASDFFEVAEKFKPECVLFAAYWYRLWTGSLTEDMSRSDKWRMVDCYEFAFMGPFGMGYKLLVLGQQRVVVKYGVDLCPGCDNRALWATARIVRENALKVWRRIQGDQSSVRDVVIRPGFLWKLDSVETAFIDYDTFLKGKVPEKVPVVCPVRSE